MQRFDLLAHTRKLALDDRRAVPAEMMYDGVDYVPAKTPVLLGHHFSSIAGAGPVVGPILAGLFFGGVPAVLWIVLGSIFVGGVHDFAALVGSIRHKARSVAELAREYMSPFAFKLALAFIWLALVYVIVVFADLTAATFEDVQFNGGGVAISAGLFLALALGFGLVDRRTRAPIWVSTLLFLPLVFAAVPGTGTVGVRPSLTGEPVAGPVAGSYANPAAFACPCHGGAYDTEGNRTAGPPVRALDRYEYEVRDGRVFLVGTYSVGKVQGEGKDASAADEPLLAGTEGGTISTMRPAQPSCLRLVASSPPAWPAPTSTPQRARSRPPRRARSPRCSSSSSPPRKAAAHRTSCGRAR